MSLKGGLGVSLVNSTPEELVYISLQNISLDYISNANSTTADISVANVQVSLMNMAAMITFSYILTFYVHCPRLFLHAKLIYCR